MEKEFAFKYEEFASEEALPSAWRNLLQEAGKARLAAYAPYSDFLVGAAVLLENGTIVGGNNQENASYPVGICAERVTLTSAASRFPESRMLALAITAGGRTRMTAKPVTPCGICRQTILEYENRYHQPIQIILQGNEGPVLVFKTAKDLLPMAFRSEDFK